MIGKCSTHARDEKCMQTFYSEIVKLILALNIKNNTQPHIKENLQACTEFTSQGGV
jgi:hypothetical protein